LSTPIIVKHRLSNALLAPLIPDFAAIDLSTNPAD